MWNFNCIQFDEKEKKKYSENRLRKKRFHSPLRIWYRKTLMWSGLRCWGLTMILCKSLWSSSVITYLFSLFSLRDSPTIQPKIVSIDLSIIFESRQIRTNLELDFHFIYSKTLIPFFRKNSRCICIYNIIHEHVRKLELKLDYTQDLDYPEIVDSEMKYTRLVVYIRKWNCYRKLDRLLTKLLIDK